MAETNPFLNRTGKGQATSSSGNPFLNKQNASSLPVEGLPENSFASTRKADFGTNLATRVLTASQIPTTLMNQATLGEPLDPMRETSGADTIRKLQQKPIRDRFTFPKPVDLLTNPFIVEGAKAGYINLPAILSVLTPTVTPEEKKKIEAGAQTVGSLLPDPLGLVKAVSTIGGKAAANPEVVSGIVSDAVRDPLNLVNPFLKATGAGKAIAKSFKNAGFKLGQMLPEGVVDALKSRFVHPINRVEPGVKEAFEGAVGQKNLAEADLLKMGKQNIEKLEPVYKGADREAINNALVGLLEKPGYKAQDALALKSDPDNFARVHTFVKAFKANRQGEKEALQKAGLFTPELKDLDYATHVITEEAKTALVKSKSAAKVGLDRAFNLSDPSLYKRTFSHADGSAMSINEINSLASKGELPGFKGLKIKKFFENDPVLIDALAKSRTSKILAEKAFYDNLKQFAIGGPSPKTPYQIAKAKVPSQKEWDALVNKELGTISSDVGDQQDRMRAAIDKVVERLAGKSAPISQQVIREGFEIEAKLLGKDLLVDQAGKPLKFDKEVAELASNAKNYIFTDELTNLYDKATGVWKSLVVFSPQFHSRNAMSNVISNAAAGVANPRFYAIAADIQQGAQGSLKALPNGKQFSYQEVKQIATKYGLDKGFLSADNPKALKEMLYPSKNPLALSRNAGSAIEANAKIAHLAAKLESGMPVDEAVMSVKKALFDYSELTAFERQVMKRALPFYAWMRKNLPRQLEIAVTNPQINSKQAILKSNVESSEPLNERQQNAKPDYFDELLSIHVGKTPGGRELFASVGTPLVDLGRFKADPKKSVTDNVLESMGQFVGDLNPALKMGIEAVTNRPTMDLTRELTVDKEKQLVAVPEFIGLLPDSVQRMIGVKENPKTKMLVMPKAAGIVVNNLVAVPQLRLAGKVGTEKQTDEEKAFAVMSFVTGVKFIPEDLKKDAMRKHKALIQERRNARSDKKKFKEIKEDEE